MVAKVFPRNFLSRRIHSLLGLFLVLYIMEHLLTNSQAALPISEDGGGFIRAVNLLKHMPYFKVLEICLVAVPFFFHAILGIRYLFTAKYNSFSSQKAPSLTKVSANHAYSWQRIAAWILLVGIILHVVQMRFLDYPSIAIEGAGESAYVVRIKMDPGLYTVADRMGVTLLGEEQVAEIEAEYLAQQAEWRPEAVVFPPGFDPVTAAELDEKQQLELEGRFVAALQRKPLHEGQVLAVSNEFGKVVLLNVRNVFKSPLMMILYSIFVVSAVYHGFRGLWSAAIVWGIAITKRSQAWTMWFSVGLMTLFGLLGFAAIWLTYWVTLYD